MATADFPRDVQPAPGAHTEHDRARQNEAAKELQVNLQALAARRNSRQLQNSLIRSTAWASGISAGLMLLHRFYLADVSPYTIGALFVGCSLVGLRNGLLHRAGIFDAALDADRALGLDDRLSSAIAFVRPDAVKTVRSVASGRLPLQRLHGLLLPRFVSHTSTATAPTQLVPALVSDAAARSQALQAKAIYPAKFDRPAKVLAVGVLALGTFAFMPDIELFRSPEQRKVSAILRREGKELAAVAKQVREKKDSEASPETKRLANRLRALGLKMQRGRMSKREALVSMGQLKKDMEKSPASGPDDRNRGGLQNLDDVAQALAGESLESAEARQAQQELKKKDANKAADALDRLADKMAKGELSDAEKEKAANDMEKVARALRKAGGPKNEEAARQLEQAARDLRNKNENQGQRGDQAKQQQQTGNGQQQGGEKQQGQQQQQQQGQNGQQGQKGQQGQNPQNGQQQQQGQQGNQSQGGQQNQQNSGQGQQGQQGSPSQNGQSQNGQSQNGQSQNGQSQGGQQGGNQGSGAQSGADALREMANGLRQGNGGSGGDSQNMQDMLDKIREAENDTGQNGGGQNGNGQNGDAIRKALGDGKGGDGKGMTPGKDLKATDPRGNVGGGMGLGPRNNATGRDSGGGVSQSRARATGDKRRWEDVWSDRLPKTQDKLSRINGKMGSGGQMEQLPTRTEAKGGPVKTPYYEVYESYKKDAEDAVSKDVVPPAYKQPVKDYFDSLKPQGN